MSDQIDPEDLYKAAYRETQGQPVDAEPRRPVVAEKDARIAELLAADEVRARVISRLTFERDASRAECEGLRAALAEAQKTMRNCQGAIESNQIEDKDVRRQLIRGQSAIDSAIRAYLEAAPSPSPAPGVVEALDIAKRIRENAGGTTAHIIAANDAHNFLERFASLYQPAKGEREGGERSQGHYDRDGYCDNPARGY
jgi:hypothetical protein